MLLLLLLLVFFFSFAYILNNFKYPRVKDAGSGEIVKRRCISMILPRHEWITNLQPNTLHCIFPKGPEFVKAELKPLANAKLCYQILLQSIILGMAKNGICTTKGVFSCYLEIVKLLCFCFWRMRISYNWTEFPKWHPGQENVCMHRSLRNENNQTRNLSLWTTYWAHCTPFPRKFS